MIFTGEVRVVSEAAHDRRGTMHATIEVTPGRVYVRSSESPSCALHFSVVPPIRPLLTPLALAVFHLSVPCSLSLRARVSRLLFSFYFHALPRSVLVPRAHSRHPRRDYRPSSSLGQQTKLRRPSTLASIVPSDRPRARARLFSANTERHRLMYPTRCITTDSHAVAATLIIIATTVATSPRSSAPKIVNAASPLSTVIPVRTLCTRVFNEATLHRRRSVTD